MGPIARRCSILEITRELGITKNCKAKRMVTPIKFLPNKIICEGGKVNPQWPFNNSKIKRTGRSEIGLPKTKSNVGQKGERRQTFEEKQARLAKVEGISSKCDFEHRRSGMVQNRK